MSFPQNSISLLCTSATTNQYQYHPTLWGDHFLSRVSDSASDTESMCVQHEALKGEIRGILRNVVDEPSKHLGLIDAIQRLGVDYHFKDEIEDALNKLYHIFDSEENNLNATALGFRLLRQHGFRVSCHVFEKFRDAKGDLKRELVKDMEGLLSLYEAAHVRIHGEDILDEAAAFTSENLQLILLTTTNIKPSFIEQIKHALNRPIRKCIKRLEARHYIDVYSNEESYNVTLLTFAKLDFNILQREHQKELKEITKWWKGLDVPTRFPYTRDRIVECFFWIVGVYFEPYYCLARKILTKTISITSILDDTYDNYASYPELELLTKAIQRWDIRDIDLLPDYMKTICSILFDTYHEFEEELANEGRSFCVNYAKDAMKKLVEAYNDEARWRSERYTPNMDEYMKVSLPSSGYQMLETTSFLGMGNIATQQVFEWISGNPKIVHASAMVNRLMDDIVSPQYEKMRDHVATGIECYMKQYGTEEGEVIKLFRKEIENQWKVINEECLKPNLIPMPILERVLNFARAMDVIYKDDDGYTNSHVVKQYVSSVLNDPLNLTLQ